jgi:hypothetical protein
MRLVQKGMTWLPPVAFNAREASIALMNKNNKIIANQNSAQL